MKYLEQKEQEIVDALYALSDDEQFAALSWLPIKHLGRNALLECSNLKNVDVAMLLCNLAVEKLKGEKADYRILRKIADTAGDIYKNEWDALHDPNVFYPAWELIFREHSDKVPTNDLNIIAGWNTYPVCFLAMEQLLLREDAEVGLGQLRDILRWSSEQSHLKLARQVFLKAHEMIRERNIDGSTISNELSKFVILSQSLYKD